MIPLSVPNIDGNEWQYVKDCLDTGWISSAGAYINKFEEAIQKYDTLNLVLRRKMYNPILLVNNLWDVGVLCQAQNFNQKAKLYYEEALDVLNMNHLNTNVQAKILNNLGVMFFKQNQFNKALEQYNKSLAIQRKLVAENFMKYLLI